MNTESAGSWPAGPTFVDKTVVGEHEVSTIICSVGGQVYGETIVFDLTADTDIAEQRCDPDHLTARIQHEEWVARMNGSYVPRDVDYEAEGRGDIEWTSHSSSLRSSSFDTYEIRSLDGSVQRTIVDSSDPYLQAARRHRQASDGRDTARRAVDAMRRYRTSDQRITTPGGWCAPCYDYVAPDVVAWHQSEYPSCDCCHTSRCAMPEDDDLPSITASRDDRAGGMDLASTVRLAEPRRES